MQKFINKIIYGDCVDEMKNTLDTIAFKTGKRLGFKFYPDQEEEN